MSITTQLVNDEARRLLALPADVAGRPVDGVGLPAELGTALAAGERRSDEIHLTADRIVVVNQTPARWGGADLGTVVTLRDHTELRALSTELTRSAASRTPSTPRRTRRPTSCTPWCR